MMKKQPPIWAAVLCSGTGIWGFDICPAEKVVDADLIKISKTVQDSDWNMAQADPEIQKMYKECEQAREWLVRATKWMPPGLHSKWWCFPGMSYLIHQRTIRLICENMRFDDEQ